MRVRRIFWVFIAVSSLGVLLFAIIYKEHVPALIQVQVDQQPLTSVGLTTVDLHLADPQGLPIEQAQVAFDAYMTNMVMTAKQSQVKTLGQGNYLALVHLYMHGPWAIHVHVHAEGFAPLQHLLFVHVP